MPNHHRKGTPAGSKAGGVRCSRRPPPLPSKFRTLEALIRRSLRERGFPDFERLALVTQQQRSMIRRNDPPGSDAWKNMARCRPEDICEAPHQCQAACLLGNWWFRAGIIIHAHDLLIDEAEDAYLVTLVRKAWRYKPGQLHTLKPASLHRWLQRRLAGIPGIRGVAYVDVSLNGRKRHRWQGHLHAVLVTSDKEALKAALAIRPAKAVSKPVMIKKIREGGLTRTLAYITKPLPEGRVPYTAENGRQRQRYVRVPSRHLREHDHWRMGMLMPARLMIIGMRMRRSGTAKCR